MHAYIHTSSKYKKQNRLHTGTKKMTNNTTSCCLYYSKLLKDATST